MVVRCRCAECMANAFRVYIPNSARVWIDLRGCEMGVGGVGAIIALSRISISRRLTTPAGSIRLSFPRPIAYYIFPYGTCGLFGVFMRK